MAEKVLLSQPFEDDSGSIVGPSGWARRDFYTESTGFGRVNLALSVERERVLGFVMFTDLGFCSVPLFNMGPDFHEVEEAILAEEAIQRLVRDAASQRQEHETSPEAEDLIMQGHLQNTMAV